MDLQAYKPQIKELIPLRNSADFNELLNKILFGENNSDKFIIKMEINRLATPCMRIIDIRDKVSEPCIQYQQETLTHYLTKETINVLKDNIKLYGLYTVGAFEAVHEYIAHKKHLQNIQKNNTKAKTVKTEQCELLPLSQKNKRGAPRMFFVSDTQITLENGESLKAQTSNLSLTGLKLKLASDIHVNNDVNLKVKFVGLSLDYAHQVLKKPISYRLVRQEHSDEKFCYFYLSYNDNKTPFTDFIKEFIKLNQHKYKIDVHYYYQIAKTIALKNSYLANMNTLPVFVDINRNNSFLFTLENKSNQQILDHWICDGSSQLPFLFSQVRLKKLFNQTDKIKITTVYTCRIRIKGKQYFLCATEEELAEKGLKQTFINYGQVKSTWRVYHLTITPYQYEPSNSNDITEVAPAIYNQITHSATLVRLAVPTFSIKESDNASVNQLSQFIHKPKNMLAPLLSFSLMSKEQRKEERYLYQSKIEIIEESHKYAGHIIDFSFSGLKIKLDQLANFSTSDVVHINFTDLQKISSKFTLSNLSYKIVRVSAKNIFHLQVNDEQTLATCQKFFALLVKNNAKHFTCHPLKEKKQPVTKYLIEVAEESLVNSVFFIAKKAGRHQIVFSSIDLPDHPLSKLFSLNSDKKHELNYYPIANNQLYQRLVNAPFKESDGINLQKAALIYIQAKKDDHQQWIFNSFLEEDFDSQKTKVKFIKESLKGGLFYAVDYRLTALNKISLEEIENETRLISRFATHLTKKLEDELAAVEAMIEITDRTEETIHSLIG